MEKKSVRIVIVQAKIQTERLPNASPQCYL
jgi:hypothetical protein